MLYFVYKSLLVHLVANIWNASIFAQYVIGRMLSRKPKSRNGVRTRFQETSLELSSSQAT
jgi:hypothetical protein